jgi:hypothetical protein
MSAFFSRDHSKPIVTDQMAHDSTELGRDTKSRSTPAGYHRLTNYCLIWQAISGGGESLLAGLTESTRSVLGGLPRPVNGSKNK